MTLTVHPGPVGGAVTAPGSKSVTHRALLLASQSATPCTVTRPLLSEDTLATLDGLRALGAQATVEPGQVPFLPARPRLPAAALDCRNAGTALRLLAATAARLGGPVLLTGDASLRSRPNDALLAALAGLGVRVESSAGRAPLRVHGPLRSGLAHLPTGSSSQFASALLLALPFVPGDSTLTLGTPIASRPYLDVTLASARQAGLRLEADLATGHIHIPGGQAVRAASLAVPGDWSSAAFPLAAAALTGGTVTVRGLDPHDAQGDRTIVELLRGFGAEVRVQADGVTCSGGSLASPGTVDVAATPDLFPVLAVVAAASRGTTTFVGGAALRHKETDRIAAMAAGLARMGVRVQERPDGLVVEGGRLQGAHVRGHGDHRIHMAFAVAGLAAQGPTTLDGRGTAAVSYPGFHADLAALGARLEAA
ncbi:MAG: 3-phosphoshikimate 1-carboxyvinyltransferase [Thermoplasmata archaeon]|jgi:3-phosphoshikimate 1-carboxyvinyltransferase|nr:3-phosphoshikimate 1-carboxyvinyltransferase [Thermoplasmata archaeon]